MKILVTDAAGFAGSSFVRYVLRTQPDVRREWGWQGEKEFSDGLARTIKWYKSDQDWMREIKDPSYLSCHAQTNTHRHDTLSRLHS